ncbi:MAG: family 10 glycosylhydrolase [Limnochordaceae bacterium]|nr:family 10 glycosylhydrolase [Limnochordaceae bacterium]
MNGGRRLWMGTAAFTMMVAVGAWAAGVCYGENGGGGNSEESQPVMAATTAVKQAQDEATKAIEAAKARINEARLKLWSFDEERANQLVAEAEQLLAQSYAASQATGGPDGGEGAGDRAGEATSAETSGATAEDPEVLALQAKAVANSVSSIAVDSRAAEARGVWIDKDILSYMSEPDMLRGLVRRLAETNINVIYVLAYDMGETIYPSPYAVQQDPHFKDWEEDPLKVIVDEAHRFGIEVQAWIGVFVGGYSGKPGPLLTAHPDWADQTRSGKKISRYGTLVVNPSIPQAQQHLLNVVGDIVQRYDVDGIQLDYARYEENGADDFGYHPYSVQLFRQQYGIDPHTISRTSPQWQTWVKWRQDQVTDFVRRVRQRIQEVRPGTLLSAAAEPIVEAATLRFQDWALWAREGIVDQVVPMDYAKDPATFQQWAQADADALRQAGGVYWYEGIGQFVLPDEETVARIELNRRLGADGTVLWSVVSMKMSTYQMLKEGPWRLPAVLPTGRPGATGAAVAAELGRLADRLEAVYLSDAEANAVVPGGPEQASVNESQELPALQSKVVELQALVNQLGSTGGALSPLTVEALRSELGYVQHLITLGVNRGTSR